MEMNSSLPTTPFSFSPFLSSSRSRFQVKHNAREPEAENVTVEQWITLSLSRSLSLFFFFGACIRDTIHVVRRIVLPLSRALLIRYLVSPFKFTLQANLQTSYVTLHLLLASVFSILSLAPSSEQYKCV